MNPTQNQPIRQAQGEKGFSAIAGIIIGLIIVAAVGVGGALIVKNQKKAQPAEQNGATAKSPLEKSITNWSAYKNISSDFVFTSDLSCPDSALAKEFNEYAARVKKDESAKSLTMFKSDSGIFFIDIIATPNYFNWDKSKVSHALPVSFANNCFLEPYISVPEYLYDNRLISIKAICAVGDAPEDPLLAAKQEAEAQQCQSMLDTIDTILK